VHDIRTGLEAAPRRLTVPKKEKTSVSQIHGKVVAFNISPKGQVEGALLDAPGRIQVNFPKHRAEELTRSARIGAQVDIKVEREPDEGDHPVYTAIDEEEAASGKIVRLNYALHGEVNGYHLEDKTFLHVKPDGAKKYKARVGDVVKATGARRAGSDVVVLEVSELQIVGARGEQRAGA
jgi:hypothetical protein